MKIKRPKAQRGRLYVRENSGLARSGKWTWSWTVYLLPESSGVTMNCNRVWVTEVGAQRHALRVMADLGIEVEE